MPSPVFLSQRAAILAATTRKVIHVSVIDSKKLRPVRLLKLSKFAFVTDPRRPYCATVDIQGNGVGTPLPMTEGEFFQLLDEMVKPVKQSCGMTHVPSVMVPAQVPEEESEEKGKGKKA